MKRPSNEARNAMLKVATQLGVTRKKEGQIRKAEDVAEDLEVRILSQGRTMLRDSAEKPATIPSNPITAPISARKPDEDDMHSSIAGAKLSPCPSCARGWSASLRCHLLHSSWKTWRIDL